MGFSITGGKGFQITFDNGYTLSVQFGAGNYCENRARMHDDPQFSRAYCDMWESNRAEIAVLDPDGNFIRLPGLLDDHQWAHDDVAGWCSADDVARVIAVVSAKKRPLTDDEREALLLDAIFPGRKDGENA